MKHCLEQRQKNKEKFTFITTGLDGPWEGGEVTVTFHFEKKNPDTKQILLSRISLWGDDDFGMEKIGATEIDFDHMRHNCSVAGSIPSVTLLRRMGFVCA